ncbi:D-2-hydroxyacid dehydrogenase family protein [Bifidobacterium sp.]|jgi:phosphoglycerate dehydrogenase-like enzyme|uniref:D-2-hydroxyacid dehydrogenase family protein n=1 Tax=Bifidobacterium sp. TaxID=41200 RepID=UPI0025C65387|nr:D-2-hydroxyacid dehydrogenase family protein [Bifidobacterium sp.]MCI1225082.1 D-2-hydroxyacid dehydrogenase family protein [Bifidobacterium sp.]
MRIIETQPERTDLPLVVVPNIVDAMLEPFTGTLDLLRDVARVRIYTEPTLDEDTLVERMEGAKGVVIIGFHVSDAMLDRVGDHVGCFAFGGTGVASYINLIATRERGIRVCNVVHYGDGAVAEHAVALMMELARHVGRMDAAMHVGGWHGEDGVSLEDKTIGLVGFGGIGQRMARIARGFGMQLLVWNSHLDVQAVRDLEATPVNDLGELFERSDIVSLHLPLLPDTAGLIASEQLNRLRPGTLFVNTARAEVIQPGALTSRLQRGDISAGLDVFDTEPLADDDPLRTLPNVVLTPHVAWRAEAAYASLTRQLSQSLAAYFKGESFNIAN